MLNWIDAVQQSPDLAGLSSLLNEVPLGALPLSGRPDKPGVACIDSISWLGDLACQLIAMSVI